MVYKPGSKYRTSSTDLLWHTVSVSPILNIVPVSSYQSHALIRQEKYSFYMVTKSFISQTKCQYIKIGGYQKSILQGRNLHTVLSIQCSFS